MKNCDKCIYKKDDLEAQKMFKCKLQDKHFNYPKLHGMLCKHYASRLIKGVNDEANGQTTKDEKEEH